MQVTVFTKKNFLKWMEKQLQGVDTVAITDIFSQMKASKKSGISATANFSDFIFKGEPDVRSLSEKKMVCIVLDPNLSEETTSDMSQTGTVSYKF